METINSTNKPNIKQLLEAVKQLSAKDRLKINDALWSENIEIPIEHQKLVLNRITKSKNKPERLLDWDEVSKIL